MNDLTEPRTDDTAARAAGAVAQRTRGRAISMRNSLVIGFGSVLLLTAAGILFNSFYTSRKIVRTLSTTILEQTRDLAEVKLHGFFGFVSEINSGTAVRLQNGLIHWLDWDSFRLFLLPMLQRVPQVTAVGGGDSDGNAYNLVRFGTNWESQEIRPSAWGDRTLWREWTPYGELVREWWEESDFDPRQRPWFTGAVAQAEQERSDPAGTPVVQRPFWTPPYKFFTSGQYGLTVATRVPWTNRLEAVVYFDVELAGLDAFVRENRPSANGFIMVLNEQLQVVAWPGTGEYSRAPSLTGKGSAIFAAENLPDLANLLKAWKAAGQPDDMVEYAQVDGQTFWLGFRSLTAAGTKFHVLVAVPENDILGEAHKERQRMLVVLAMGLLVSVGLAFWLAAAYTRPISSLVSRSRAIQRLDLSQHSEIPSRIAEVRLLSTAQARMASALESFSRYVPRDVIAELLRRGDAAKIGAHPADLTVLFSDIRQFTAISESLSPDEVARFLSDYFDLLHGVIDRHQGTTDKFIGDAIMAFWGAPRPDDQHALNAVRAALECLASLERLNKHWKADGRPEFQTTFGLASGPAVVGNVGARTRLNYTVLGNTVNVASRCVGLGRQLGCSILALESVAKASAAQIEWRRLGPVQVRGIRAPMMVCEPLGLRGQAPAESIAFREQYQCALDAYLNKDFTDALKVLKELEIERPGELSVAYLARRCRELAQSPPDDLQTDMLSFG